MGKRKLRIYELAKMLDISSKDLLQILQDLGVEAKSHMSSIDMDTAQIIEETLREEKETKPSKPDVEAVAVKEAIEIKEGSTVEVIANRLGKPAMTMVKELIAAGFMVPANAIVDEKIANIISEVYNVDVKISPADLEKDIEKDA